ncbi:hypothetical protein E2R55_07040 [Vibrio vulnificus]|nr:hypothetical protein E2R55_07040 [Vibrio vulnificus]
MPIKLKFLYTPKQKKLSSATFTERIAYFFVMGIILFLSLMAIGGTPINRQIRLKISSVFGLK